VSVGPQEVAVVKTPRGVKETPLTTGWHFVLPWWDTYKMDKTVWVYTFTESKTEGAKTGADAIWAPTSEGIKMGFDMSVSWRIDPAFAPWIFQNVSEADGGPDGRYKWIEENVIRTKTKSVFALTACKFTPIQCYSTGRQEIQNIVDTELRKELTKYHIILDQVDIREVFYDPGYEAELKNKKIQEQKALTLIEVTKQKNEELTQAKINKDIAIEQAEGEAKSLQIKGNSITNNPRIIELEWINKWNGALPNYMMGGNSNMMMTMPAPTQR
jgi:regulator of protease activity HflC (stomatin/prohibitin superfamily)